MTTISRGIRRTTSPVTTKFLGGVGERQVRVVASDATPDRMGDVLDPNGCDLRNYYKNPIVLAQHDSNQPIGRCSDIAVRGGQVVATIEFPPAGINERSDEYLEPLAWGFCRSRTNLGRLADFYLRNGKCWSSVSCLCPLTHPPW